MNNNIAPMPTQNPWGMGGDDMGIGMGVGVGVGTQCRALLPTHLSA